MCDVVCGVWVLQVYEAPLKEKAKTMMGKILKPSHISVIFSNMGEILEVHREFLSRMQDESAKDVRMMGQLLIDHVRPPPFRLCLCLLLCC